MRVLLVNGNTSDEVTETLAEVARGAAGPDTEIVQATGALGVRRDRHPERFLRRRRLGGPAGHRHCADTRTDRTRLNALLPALRGANGPIVWVN